MMKRFLVFLLFIGLCGDSNILPMRANDKALRRFNDAEAARKAYNGKTVVIVTGTSSAGKSTFSKTLMKSLPHEKRCTYIALDNIPEVEMEEYGVIYQRHLLSEKKSREECQSSEDDEETVLPQEVITLHRDLNQYTFSEQDIRCENYALLDKVLKVATHKQCVVCDTVFESPAECSFFVKIVRHLTGANVKTVYLDCSWEKLQERVERRNTSPDQTEHRDPRDVAFQYVDHHQVASEQNGIAPELFRRQEPEIVSALGNSSAATLPQSHSFDRPIDRPRHSVIVTPLLPDQLTASFSARVGDLSPRTQGLHQREFNDRLSGMGIPSDGLSTPCFVQTKFPADLVLDAGEMSIDDQVGEVLILLGLQAR